MSCSPCRSHCYLGWCIAVSMSQNELSRTLTSRKAHWFCGWWCSWVRVWPIVSWGCWQWWTCAITSCQHWDIKVWCNVGRVQKDDLDIDNWRRDVWVCVCDIWHVPVRPLLADVHIPSLWLCPNDIFAFLDANRGYSYHSICLKQSKCWSKYFM